MERQNSPKKVLTCEDCGNELELTVNHRLDYAECECGGDMTPEEED